MTHSEEGKRADITWEAPPESGVKYDWEKIAALLKTEPGKWARIFDKDRVSVVNAIRQGSVQAVRPDLGFQVRTTNNDRQAVPRTCTLYMRYDPDRDTTKRRRKK